MSKKSSFPSMKEFAGFAGKLARDIKKSVCEIMTEYEKSRKDNDKAAPSKPTEPAKKPSSKSKPTPKTTVNKDTDPVTKNEKK